ncbi:MAG TPA: DEAD/DEAH box helicase [Candidatus Hydrogenedentes bacterium]|nr:DEAD/DEAH box helicase [Candidatus Hydrogenedentota bacterium]
MIRLSIENGYLVFDVSDGCVAARHENQLAFWGFKFDPVTRRFLSPAETSADFVAKVLSYLSRSQIPHDVSAQVEEMVERSRNAGNQLAKAKAKGQEFKDGTPNHSDAEDFLSFLRLHVCRDLKEHQIKAALHLLAVKNAANFSVPGSGKTAVVLATFHRLRLDGEVDALFVVGPPACFGPWRAEYEVTLGTAPSCEILAGGDIDGRRSKYQVNRDSVSDLYLTSFQTLQRDWGHVRVLFEHQGIRFFFVVDEAHYIKQLDGAWANAVLSLACHAERRCILTGTPFPHSYADAFNLFDMLWPDSPPISKRDKSRIEYFHQRKKVQEASRVLHDAVSPLFYRVRKEDLNLAPQRFHQPIHISMNRYEKLVYDAVLDKVREVSQSDYFRNIDLVLRLRRGRMVRLRQCISYTALLQTAVDEYSENLLEDELSLADVIGHYDTLEAPAKLEVLLSLVKDLRMQGEKVVIWSNFVRTLELIRDVMSRLGMGVRLIYGGTPLQNENIREELSREGIIREFVKPDSGVDILVANPAACAESISLHKTCAHAIYYDLSYNCAQYLQSLDRIHRVGGSELKEANYHFLQYEDSIDQDILANLQRKAARMSEIIDQDYPIYSLDMFAEDEELEAYERLFGNTQ